MMHLSSSEFRSRHDAWLTEHGKQYDVSGFEDDVNKNSAEPTASRSTLLGTDPGHRNYTYAGVGIVEMSGKSAF